MRALVCAVVATIGLVAHPVQAQTERPDGEFWKAVQARCDATAAKPSSETGQRIAQTAIEEFSKPRRFAAFSPSVRAIWLSAESLADRLVTCAAIESSTVD